MTKQDLLEKYTYLDESDFGTHQDKSGAEYELLEYSGIRKIIDNRCILYKIEVVATVPYDYVDGGRTKTGFHNAVKVTGWYRQAQEEYQTLGESNHTNNDFHYGLKMAEKRAVSHLVRLMESIDGLMSRDEFISEKAKKGDNLNDYLKSKDEAHATKGKKIDGPF